MCVRALTVLRTSCALSHILSVHVIELLLAVKERPEWRNKNPFSTRCVFTFLVNTQDDATDGLLLRHELCSHNILMLCSGGESAAAT